MVPDLHGRLDLLLAALRQFPEAHFLSLGDAIDRGPRSLATVDKLLELHDQGRATLLMGNHERMAQEGLKWYRRYSGTHDMGDYRKAMEGYQWWMQAGGDTVRRELPQYAAEHGGPSSLTQKPGRIWRATSICWCGWCIVTADGVIHAQVPPQPSVLVAHASPPVSHPAVPPPRNGGAVAAALRRPLSAAAGGGLQRSRPHPGAAVRPGWAATSTSIWGPTKPASWRCCR